ncbi:Alkaline nuclease [Folsomia candida]|uniref:Alkaline nuclease n=1 Tax=Folsomia candida TaxID=158441 RepID=A0A226DNQ2_FOLCA|nr:Alkaline nuclease [Folsomia candida]
MAISAHHQQTCTGNLLIIEKRNSLLNIQCQKCDETFSCHNTSRNTLLSYNEALVWGLYLSGSNYQQMQVLFTALQVKIPSFSQFQITESDMLQKFKKAQDLILKKNGEHVKNMAIERGSYVYINEKKIPAVNVVVDGSWSKRSYGHGYDSNTGMAVIIEEESKLVLWIGTRNKYCRLCAMDRISQSHSSHICTKYRKSSQSMEADIIVEGFNKSIEIHGLVYQNVIGDGDSSVYNEILNRVNYPNIMIRKFECINHALKNLKKPLIESSTNTKHKLDHRKLLKSQIERIATAAASAIIYNHEHQFDNPATTSQTLRDDIINIPYHAFGCHKKCKSYFCGRKHEPDDTIILQNSIIWLEIKKACENLANKSGRLIQNKNSNLCEGFMAQVSKYVQGKRLNVSQKNGYDIRVLSALFGYQFGPFWLAGVKEILDEVPLPKIWDDLSQRYKYHNINNAKYKRRKLEKIKSANGESIKKKVSMTSRSRGDKDYGNNAQCPDIDTDLLESIILEKMNELQVSDERQQEIEEQTRNQSEGDNERWFLERKFRITASKAGNLFSLRDSTNNSCTIKDILYSQKPFEYKTDDHRARGLRLEPLARKRYEEEMKASVTRCGLIVSLDNGIFAASPDGFVGSEGILEIKCPAVPATQVISRKNDKFLEISPTGIRLKRKHKYFYQIVLQLYCAKRSWCDFVVYYNNEDADAPMTDFWYERIFVEETRPAPIFNTMPRPLTILILSLVVAVLLPSVDSSAVNLKRCENGKSFTAPCGEKAGHDRKNPGAQCASRVADVTSKQWDGLLGFL